MIRSMREATHASAREDSGDSSWRYDKGDKAKRYRYRSSRRRPRERALLARVLDGIEIGDCLDVPCGAGRLADFVQARGGVWTGCDLSAAMLDEARDAGARRVLRAHASALPFADASFDSALCFRFLHHLEGELQATLVAELARVARARVVLSAFAPWSFHGLQRTLRLRLSGRPRRRFSTSAAELDREFARAGFRRARAAREGFGRELWLGVWERSSAGGRDA